VPPLLFAGMNRLKRWPRFRNDWFNHPGITINSPDTGLKAQITVTIGRPPQAGLRREGRSKVLITDPPAPLAIMVTTARSPRAMVDAKNHHHCEETSEHNSPSIRCGWARRRRGRPDWLTGDSNDNPRAGEHRHPNKYQTMSTFTNAIMMASSIEPLAADSPRPNSPQGSQRQERPAGIGKNRVIMSSDRNSGTPYQNRVDKEPRHSRESSMAITHGRPVEAKTRANPDPLHPAGKAAPDRVTSSGLDLRIRPRRNRKADWTRRMVREHTLTVDDLIWPIFLVDGKRVHAPIASMPDVARLSVDEAVRAAERACKLEIPCIALFPYTDPKLRNEEGTEALNPDNLVCRAIRAIKREVPDIGILCDVALDPYTSHGHDGLMRSGAIVNDETVEVLVQQALVEAQAGADIIAPSDMMDGRVGAIRSALDRGGFGDVSIMAYAAKYASAFYGPFRDAVGSAQTLTGDKRTYQMDPMNSDEALREVELDIREGADMIMVKPGLPYLDVLHRVVEAFRMPTFAYQVSGEYAMIMAAAQNGWLDGDKAMLESLMAFKRAGASGVLSYFAPRAAKQLRSAD
jgi:porphobilinogen synthase